LENNVAWNWERAEFETFMRRVDQSRSWATRALESDCEADAIELWQKVFNREGEDEYFPSIVEDTAKAMAAARVANSLRVTSTGALVTGRLPGTPSVPSPVHQFYGDD
jgi:hypothetical protein